MNKGFFIPRNIEEKLIEVLVKATREKKLNLGLFLDKYVLWWYDDRENELKCNLDVQLSLLKKVANKADDIRKLLTSARVRGRKFREEMTRCIKLSISSDYVPIPLKYKADILYRKKIDYMLDILSQEGYHIEYLPDKQSGLTLNWRLAINLGAASVYETSLLFHRNYSVPFIPGSAVKGVTRHWAIQKFAEMYQKSKDISFESAVKDVEEALENGEDLGIKADGIKFNELIEIFGTKNNRGKVIFFDALPIIEQDKDFIVLDVMNVHYRDYYQDERGVTPPGDWMNPNPVFFLAVERGVKFRFALASRNEKRNKDLVKKAKRLLEEALGNIGISAKTSAGYGYFEVSTS